MQSLELVNKLLKEKYPDPTNKRYMHILGVKDMAIKLAQIYHEDVNKATIAALMHDYSKYDSIDDAKGKLSDEDIEECKKYPFLLHAYLSAYYYKELVGNDLDIYNAIKKSTKPNIKDPIPNTVKTIPNILKINFELFSFFISYLHL